MGVSQTLRRWTEGATYIRKGDHHVGHWPTFLVRLFLRHWQTYAEAVCHAGQHTMRWYAQRLYSAMSRTHTEGSDMDHTVLPLAHYTTSVHQMAPQLTEVEGIWLKLATHLSTRKDERLSWPRWLTYSGWHTDISGYPSATGRAQDREVCRPKDRRSTTVPRNQPTGSTRVVSETSSFLNFYSSHTLNKLVLNNHTFILDRNNMLLRRLPSSNWSNTPNTFKLWL